MKRKLVISSFIVLALGIGGTFSFIAYQKHKDKELKNKVITKMDQEINSSVGKRNYEQEIDHKGKATVVSYVPVLKNHSENGDLRKLLKRKAEQSTKKLQDKNAIIFYTFTENKLTKDMDSYHLYEQIYKKNNHHFVPQGKRKITLAKTLVFDKKTGKMLNLEDVLYNDPTMVVTLRRFMQDGVIASKKIPMKNIDKLADVKYPSTLREVNFNITKKDLIIPIHVPGVPSISEVNIPLQQIARYFHPKYLPDGVSIPKKTSLPPDKKIALTFDDGPHQKTTLKILETLKKYNAKATFFVVGSAVLKNPGLVKRELKEGHQVGNHSFDHPALTKLSKKEVVGQILKTQMAVYEQTGYFPRIVRPPYGAIRKDTAAFVSRPIIQWYTDTADWKVKNATKITDAVLKKPYDGDIVLMHDTRPTSAESLDNTLKKLKEQGYQFVTISELLEDKEKPTYEYFDGKLNRKVK